MYDSATGTYEEIISEGPGGQYGDTLYEIYSALHNMPGTAYAQKCYTRNAQGELYSIYGSCYAIHRRRTTCSTRSTCSK